jgi:hypothetical protein
MHVYWLNIVLAIFLQASRFEALHVLIILLILSIIPKQNKSARVSIV